MIYSTDKTIDPSAAGRYHINQEPFGDSFVKNGDFVYADPYATYVEITGEFRKVNADGTSGIVAERMHYIIHLGYVDDNANNWEADSNGSYVYNIKINGLGELATEVIKDNEVNTAVTGEVLEYKKLELRDALSQLSELTIFKEYTTFLITNQVRNSCGTFAVGNI